MISFSFPEITPLTAVAAITALALLASILFLQRTMHRYRFFGVAYLAVLATVLLACALSQMFDWPLGITGLGLFSLGMIVHRLAHIRTTWDRWMFPMTDGKNWRDIVAEGCVQYGGALSAFNPYGVETVFHKSTKWSVSFRKALSRHFSTKQLSTEQMRSPSSTAVTNTSSTPSACPFLRVIGVSRGSAPVTEEDAVPVDVSTKQKSTKQT